MLISEQLLARKEENNFQTLREHSFSTAKKAKSRCPIKVLEEFFYLAGTIHDIGKSYDRWQKYLLSEGSEVVPHSTSGIFLIKRLFSNIEIKYSECILQLLCISIWGHHGGLRDILSPDGTKNIPSEVSYSIEETRQAENRFFNQVISKEKLIQMFIGSCKAYEKILNHIFNYVKQDKLKANKSYFYLGLIERSLYSAVIDGDRTDAAEWNKRQIPTTSYPSWNSMNKHLDKRLNGFNNQGNDHIHELRNKISQTCGSFDTGTNGIYRIIVPTGGGKTLSSLRLCLNMAEKYNKKHIFYIAPYLTIIEQNADEIRKSVEDSNKSESAVLEHHSDIIFEEDEKDDEILHIHHCEKWDTPIIMTSAVQYLNVFYSNKSAAIRRINSLADSIVIFDEVQSIPTSSLYLFNMSVNYLSEFCNCIIILCTATQPSLEETEYGINLNDNSDIIEDTNTLFKEFKRTEINFCDNGKKDSDDIARLAVEKANDTRSCLVIVNTKSMARKIYDSTLALNISDTKVFYLSTLLCPANRRKRINEMCKKLKNKEKIICISTQLIEAGVDVSFGSVIRSNAGLGSIIQAAGRCNRHGECEKGNVYVVSCEENVSPLKDIQDGQGVITNLKYDFNKNPNDFDNDITSPKAITTFYKRYFNDIKLRLDYVIENKTITELLGKNKNARNEYNADNNPAYNCSLLAQSFRTAWKGYKPIADNTTGVIVNYENSFDIVEKLKNCKDDNKAKYVRSLQKYTVNVFENVLKSLFEKGAISYDENLELWVLDKNYYNEETGIDTKSIDKIDEDKYFM